MTSPRISLSALRGMEERGVLPGGSINFPEVADAIYIFDALGALIEYVEAGEALAALQATEYTTAEWDAAIERVGAARVPFREADAG